MPPWIWSSRCESTDGLDHRGGVQPLTNWTERGERRDADRVIHLD